jgi:hypothetical protein
MSRIPAGYLGRIDGYMLKNEMCKTALGSANAAVVTGSDVERVVLIVSADALEPSFRDPVKFMEAVESLEQIKEAYLGKTGFFYPATCRHVQIFSRPEDKNGFIAVYSPDDYRRLTNSQSTPSQFAKLQWLRPVAAFMDVLHFRGISHGSVCAANIVEIDGAVRLAHPFLGPNVYKDRLVHDNGYRWPWTDSSLKDRHDLASCVMHALVPTDGVSWIGVKAESLKVRCPTLTEQQLPAMQKALSQDAIDSFTCVEFADQFIQDGQGANHPVRVKKGTRRAAKSLWIGAVVLACVTVYLFLRIVALSNG